MIKIHNFTSEVVIKSWILAYHHLQWVNKHKKKHSDRKIKRNLKERKKQKGAQWENKMKKKMEYEITRHVHTHSRICWYNDLNWCFYWLKLDSGRAKQSLPYNFEEAWLCLSSHFVSVLDRSSLFYIESGMTSFSYPEILSPLLNIIIQVVPVLIHTSI